MPALLASIIRTFVPLIVGLILSVTIFAGLDDNGALTNLVTVVVTAAYYLVVRLLERLDGRFGWLLGYGAQPKYTPPAGA